MSAFQVLTETNAVSVAILNVKIAATVGLVADITRDLHALRLEFSIERISIVVTRKAGKAIHCRLDRGSGLRRSPTRSCCQEPSARRVHGETPQAHPRSARRTSAPCLCARHPRIG